MCIEAIRLTYLNPGPGLIGATTLPGGGCYGIRRSRRCRDYERNRLSPTKYGKAENVLTSESDGCANLVPVPGRIRGCEERTWHGSVWTSDVTRPEALARWKGRFADQGARRRRLCGLAVWTPKGTMGYVTGEDHRGAKTGIRT